ncbi:MAG: extracellular solute-binding protein [Deltaproteobacteria bacterium]|nr:extracellular solute-binding protein [Deltaproteobacteria bacterium]
MKIRYLIVVALLQLIGLQSYSLNGWMGAREALADWKDEWAKTVKAAEKEGQVTIYISGYRAVVDSGAFQQKYPKIKVVSVTGSGSTLTPRIAAERRAGKYLTDVYGGGGNSLFQVLYLGRMLDSIKSTFILPEVADPSGWWEGKHKFVDREEEKIFVYEGNVSAGATPGYNTKLLKPRKYRSYWDFLDPKLKGKVVSVDLTKVRGAGLMWQYLYYHPRLGPEFVRRFFSEMDVTMTGSLRQAVDWLATGKHHLCLPCRDVADGNRQGLPVDSFANDQFKEGMSLSSAFGQMALMKNAPHPNAAKVFINWYLSREGQSAFQKVMSKPGSPKDSRRDDVSKDHIPEQDRRQKGVKYFDGDNPDVKDIRPIIKQLKQIMAAKR